MRLAVSVVVVLSLRRSTTTGDFVVIQSPDIAPRRCSSISHALVTSRRVGMFTAFHETVTVIVSVRARLASTMSDSFRL